MIEPEQLTYAMRAPTRTDGHQIWRLVRESGVLDENSAYAYLLLCRDFAESCLVAEAKGQVVGFVTAYRKAEAPDRLFVWQVGVSVTARKKGVALALLTTLLRRCTLRAPVRFIEATISPSNAASRRLFQSLAHTLGAPLEEDADAGFRVDEFPPGHEAEPLIRIGPIGDHTTGR